MFTFLIVLISILAVILTLVVLLQSGKGGGLAGIAAGGSTTQILGARQAPDVLEKATWVLATLFIVLCILTNFTIDRGEAGESVIQQRGIPTEEPGVDMAPPPAQELPAPQQLPDEGGAGEEGGN
jgi:preprotein translocase subunit SecG